MSFKALTKILKNYKCTHNRKNVDDPFSIWIWKHLCCNRLYFFVTCTGVQNIRFLISYETVYTILLYHFLFCFNECLIECFRFVIGIIFVYRWYCFNILRCKKYLFVSLCFFMPFYDFHKMWPIDTKFDYGFMVPFKSRRFVMYSFLYRNIKKIIISFYWWSK